MNGEAVLLDESTYQLLMGFAALYGVTWLNTIVPNAADVSNPWAKAALRAWEMASANVLKSGNAKIEKVKGAAK